MNFILGAPLGDYLRELMNTLKVKLVPYQHSSMNDLVVDYNNPKILASDTQTPSSEVA